MIVMERFTVHTGDLSGFRVSFGMRCARLMTGSRQGPEPELSQHFRSYRLYCHVSVQAMQKGTDMHDTTIKIMIDVLFAPYDFMHFF